jgi:hypothetical protein
VRDNESKKNQLVWRKVFLCEESARLVVTSQDFIKFWGNFFILLVLIEISQGFRTFEFI